MGVLPQAVRSFSQISLRKDFGRSQSPPTHLLHTVPVGSGWSHVPCGKKAGRGSVSV